MRLAALIEITSTADGQLPMDLIQFAYRTSERALVVIVTADDLRDRVDRALDPLVLLLPMTIPGVRFVSENDHAAIAHYAQLADRVVLSRGLRARLTGTVPGAGEMLPVVAGDVPAEWHSGAPLPIPRAVA